MVLRTTEMKTAANEQTKNLIIWFDRPELMRVGKQKDNERKIFSVQQRLFLETQLLWADQLEQDKTNGWSFQKTLKGEQEFLNNGPMI